MRIDAAPWSSSRCDRAATRCNAPGHSPSMTRVSLVPGAGIEPRRDPRCDALQRVATRWETRLRGIAGARSGDRTHMTLRSRDFKSLASTSFAIRAQAHGAACVPQTEIPAGAGICLRDSARYADMIWRPRSELNRRTRICSPLHNHSATRPVTLDAFTSRARGANRSPKNSRKTYPGNYKAPRAGPCLNLERETRLELATPTLARSCSTN
jgi:hypothetical protein